LATDLSPDFPRKVKPFPSFTGTPSGAAFGDSSGDVANIPGTRSVSRSGERRLDPTDPLSALEARQLLRGYGRDLAAARPRRRLTRKREPSSQRAVWSAAAL